MSFEALFPGRPCSGGRASPRSNGGSRAQRGRARAVGRLRGLGPVLLVAGAIAAAGVAGVARAQSPRGPEEAAIVAAQLAYQASRLQAGRAAAAEAAAEEPMQALPPGGYTWAIEFRCATEALCVEAFGAPILVPWLESYTFMGHVTSDGQRMTYAGSNIFRGRPGAGPEGACDDPLRTPFSGICMLGETADAFLQASSLPGPLHGQLTLWATNALLFSPRADGENDVIACACGPEGVETPTLGVPMTLTTRDFLGGREPPAGVAMVVQLVKLP